MTPGFSGEFWFVVWYIAARNDKAAICGQNSIGVTKTVFAIFEKTRRIAPRLCTRALSWQTSSLIPEPS